MSAIEVVVDIMGCCECDEDGCTRKKEDQKSLSNTSRCACGWEIRMAGLLA